MFDIQYHPMFPYKVFIISSNEEEIPHLTRHRLTVTSHNEDLEDVRAMVCDLEYEVEDGKWKKLHRNRLIKKKENWAGLGFHTQTKNQGTLVTNVITHFVSGKEYFLETLVTHNKIINFLNLQNSKSKLPSDLTLYGYKWRCKLCIHYTHNGKQRWWIERFNFEIKPTESEMEKLHSIKWAVYNPHFDETYKKKHIREYLHP